MSARRRVILDGRLESESHSFCKVPPALAEASLISPKLGVGGGGLRLRVDGRIAFACFGGCLL